MRLKPSKRQYSKFISYAFVGAFLFIMPRLSSAFSCSSLLNHIKPDADSIVTTSHTHVVIDKSKGIVYKAVGNLREVEDLKFGTWLFSELKSKIFRANNPIEIIPADEFLGSETIGFPEEFLEDVNEDRTSHVVLYPYIIGTEFIRTDLRRYPLRDRAKIQETARITWAEIERMLNLVRSEVFMYNGYRVKASLDFDPLLFGPDLSIDRMLNVNGRSKIVNFHAGRSIYDSFEISLSFGENNIYDNDGNLILIDPY